jgi:geranylgeranyl reductase family protein
MSGRLPSNSRFQYDVAVIGAGPAGSMAAMALAHQGASVVLLEKESLPRYKVCGGGLLARARHLLPADLFFPIEREIYAAELNLLDSDRHFVVRRDFPVVTMVMRSDFDNALVEYAQRKGAHVRAGCEVKSIEPEAKGVILRTTNGTVSARFAIAADGAKGAVMKKLGLVDSRYAIPAVEWEIRVDDATFERFSKTARFDYGATPHGYGWIFPKKDHLSVGLLTVQRGRYPLKKAAEDYIYRILDRSSVLDVVQHGFVIPVEPQRGSLVHRRLVLTGDAAGFADPLTAEGITHALLSGQLAAQAILQGDFDETKVADSYQREVSARILKELRLARLLANGLYMKPWFRNPVMRWFGHSFCEAMTNVITGSRTYQELLLNPTKYVKLVAKARFTRNKPVHDEV